MKIGEMMLEIFKVFVFFQVTHLPPGKWVSTWKMGTKFYGNLCSCHTIFLYNSNVLIIIHKQFLNWLNSFCGRIYYMCFPLYLEKVKNETKFWGKKIQLVLCAAYWIERRWNFDSTCIVCRILD